MILSVFYQHIADAARQQNISVSETLRLARSMGYTMVEMDFNELESDASIPSLLKENGFSISSIYCFFQFDQFHDAERIRSLIDRAVQLDVKCVMPIPGFFHAENEEGRAEELERMLSSMEILTRDATAAGISAVIEDFDSIDSPIRNSALMRRFLDRIPDLSVAYDVGNFRFSAESEKDAFQFLRGRIAHVHLKDRLLMPEYGDHPLVAMDGIELYPCPIGVGVVPMDWILNELRQMDYRGVLTVEHFGCRDALFAMRQSSAYVQNHWNLE